MKTTDFINTYAQESVDPSEYNDEAPMIKNDLHTIVRVATHLNKALGEHENLPTWVIEKLAQTKGMLVSVMDYMISQHEMGQKDEIPGFDVAQVEQMFESAMAETTGDKPFDNMIKNISKGTKKQATADRQEQKAQNKEQARDAFGGMFGGGNPADKLKIKEQGMVEGNLKEFAPNGGGNGGDDYLRTLASAWYNQDLSAIAHEVKKDKNPKKKGMMDRVIDAQVAVEKMLARGVVCGDGKVRKFSIDYNSGFDGVVMTYEDYAEYIDYGDNGEDIDSRTGKPWPNSKYDQIEFTDDQLDETVSIMQEDASAGASGASSIAVTMETLGQKGGFSKSDVHKKITGYSNMQTRGGPVKVKNNG